MKRKLVFDKLKITNSDCNPKMFGNKLLTKKVKN